MKQKKLLTKLTTASLALLLLLTATVGRSMVLHKLDVKKPVAVKTDKEKQAKDERPVIQEMSIEAVVAPAISFDFEQSFYFLPTIFSFELPVVCTLPKRFDVFYYFFSFFRNVFGHFIAINAP
ncbi:hypothetical protein P1X15_14560 [Runella sp. MFBS21]|uniref:hypothetical protein n=1 Tax=Runella sp. MFBS21 TaxID=3034018 RepID=UPI0023F64809|nr:hypothetical protein [Runella sp. MFBS21]MDF7818834.1 hypothetical protein [Runella sp. MFBS21]